VKDFSLLRLFSSLSASLFKTLLFPIIPITPLKRFSTWFFPSDGVLCGGLIVWNPIGKIGNNRENIGNNPRYRESIGGTPGNRLSRALNRRPSRHLHRATNAPGWPFPCAVEAPSRIPPPRFSPRGFSHLDAPTLTAPIVKRAWCNATPYAPERFPLGGKERAASHTGGLFKPNPFPQKPTRQQHPENPAP